MKRAATPIHLLLALIVGLTLAPPAEAARTPDLVFHGNQALIDPVLAMHVKLGRKARADRRTADRVASQLRGFLRDAGYTLADVRVEPQEGALHVFVDEGRLERVVFHGFSSWRTLNLSLLLHLPGHVFNRPHVDREIERLAAAHQLPPLRYEVLSLDEEHGGSVGIGRLKSIPIELLWSRAPSKYELHVWNAERGWGEGWGASLAYASPEGARASLSWSDDRLLFKDDRYRVESSVAGWTRRSLIDDQLMVALTKAEQKLRWMTPPIFGRWLRNDLAARASLTNLQRGDLGVDKAWLLHSDVSFNLRIEPLPSLRLVMGAGYRWRGVGAVQTIPGRAVTEEGAGKVLLHAELTLDLPAADLRRDRSHRASLQLTEWGLWGGDDVSEVVLAWRKVFGIGYSDLALHFRGTWMTGKGLEWFDAESITGRAFHVAPAGASYTERALRLGLAYRLSLHRDFLKVGVFLDGAWYDIPVQRPFEGGRLAMCAGPSLTILTLDTFEFNAFYGLSRRDDGEVGDGAGFMLSKVY